MLNPREAVWNNDDEKLIEKKQNENIESVAPEKFGLILKKINDEERSVNENGRIVCFFPRTISEECGIIMLL